MEDPLILSVTAADPDTLVSSHSTELTLVVTPEMTPLPTSVPRPFTDRGKGDENKEGKTEGNFENGLQILLLVGVWAGGGRGRGEGSHSRVILGVPGAVSRAGRKGATKVFKHRRKSPWVPDHF